MSDEQRVPVPKASDSTAGRHKLQLPSITLHGLRHTWATLALSAGIDIKFVSERRGFDSDSRRQAKRIEVGPSVTSLQGPG